MHLFYKAKKNNRRQSFNIYKVTQTSTGKYIYYIHILHTTHARLDIQGHLYILETYFHIIKKETNWNSLVNTT